MSRSLLISNFILFQIGWFACVLGGAHQLGIAGSLAALLISTIHLWRAQQRWAELRLQGIALLIGLVFESALVLSGLTVYSNGMIFGQLAPHWMLMLWVLFATTLNVSMRWIKDLHPGWIALLGAILAPLSYLAGSRLGSVTFPEPLLALGAIAAGWAILLPLLAEAAKKLNGVAAGQSAWRSANV